jgi:hypothetical protein
LERYGAVFKEAAGYLLATVSMVWSNCILWAAWRGDGGWSLRWFDVPPLLIAGFVSLIVYGLVFRGVWCLLFGSSKKTNTRLAACARFVIDGDWRREMLAERRRLRRIEEDARRREALIRIAHRCKADRISEEKIGRETS